MPVTNRTDEMCILHVVSMITPDGAYGGPVQVALNQAAALRDAGHSVVVAAGQRGFTSIPTEMAGVPLKLFRSPTVIPKTGFAGVCSPTLLHWVRSHRNDFDVVHVHLARDLVTLPVAYALRRSRTPYVVQTHGMIIPSANPLAAPLDLLWTRRVLRDAHTVFHLNEQENSDLHSVARPLRAMQLNNGVPYFEPTTRPDSAEIPEVLFLARLHERKRPMHFVESAARLLADGVRARFTLVGPDEGQGALVRERIKQIGRAEITWEGPIGNGQAPARMARSSIFVLPSINEPYGMSVVEAMSAGIPVVITDSCGLADLVRDSGCGIVVAEDQDALTSGIGELLVNPKDASRMGRLGQACARSALSMQSIAGTLTGVYASAAEGR